MYWQQLRGREVIVAFAAQIWLLSRNRYCYICKSSDTNVITQLSVQAYTEL